MNKKIGISAMGFYFPRHYVSIERLLEMRKEDPEKATKGIGVERMAILSSNEDSITMGANAVESLQFDKEKVGKLIFATECGVDSAKDNASYIHELCGLPSDCEAYDIKSACASSSYALWQIIDWISSGRGKDKLGLIVCSDKALYEYNTGAEITGGGGAIALLISENPDIIHYDFITGCYKKNVRDFWKPLNSECSVLAGDGKVSIYSYLDALKSCFMDYKRKGGNKEFDYFVFHTPYSKMVLKAFNTLSEILPEIKGRFETMTLSSLKAPSLIGNIYNGSLYLALASLLESKESAIRGKYIGNFSFGSGMSSILFRGLVNSDFHNGMKLFKQINDMRELNPEKYELIRKEELLLVEEKGVLLDHIDKQGYRHYIVA